MTDDRFAHAEPPPCEHCRFGLIVTGKGEREFLPNLFTSLGKRAGCSFRVLRKIDQRGPITTRRQLKMVGRGEIIPSKDEEEIGLAARRYLRDQPCHFVILIDDVEFDRQGQITEIWTRYRTAIDTMLLAAERQRAAVHFLANMLEAYYFADYRAVNSVLGASVLSADYAGDVESIRHPKNELSDRARRAGIDFDERRDGAGITKALDVDHVLSRRGTCRFLRALFGWCVNQLRENCPIWDETVVKAFELADGAQADLTQFQ